MRRNSRSFHPVARRVAMASLTVLAASGVGLVAAPMAFGQIALPIGSLLGGGTQSAGVTNGGSASANSGGNTAVGNSSANSITISTPAATVSVPVSVGAPTNTSDGSATITSGAANAVGNSSGTGVGQSNASGNQVNGFLNQSAGVTNAGSASANSGGNTAVGNNSTNTQTVSQNVTGGLVGVGVNVGALSNTSSGTATITSGAANAVGNTSETQVGQSSVQGGAGGPVRAGVGGAGPGAAAIGAAPCSVGRFAPVQQVGVRNEGQAQANTGNNRAIGNDSINDISTTIAGGSGGVAGVPLTIGAPTNTSSGTAVITTGPASAVGNSSVTEVGQQQTTCPQVVTVAARPGVVVQPRVGTLARTGLDSSDLGMIAGALVGAGILLVASQRRRMVARSAGVPMAGFGLGMGGDDWDGAIR
jgi:hypothetical protein